MMVSRPHASLQSTERLVLLTDAYGSSGGIALFNRFMLEAIAARPDNAEVLAHARVPGRQKVSAYPPRLCYWEFAHSRYDYVTHVVASSLRNRSPSLIVCAHISLLPVASLIRLWVRAPILLIIHGIDAWSVPSPLVRRLIRQVDGVISVSQLTLDRFLCWAEVDRTRCFVLPNAVNLNEFCPGPRDRELVERYRLAGRKVLMTLGRLESAERAKGFDEILDIMPRLLRKVPNVVYLIAGDGNDRQRLADKARRLGITDNVIFAGFVSESEKVKHFRLADAYVMPSRGEGFGFVLIEAMACGVPVVASSVDGGREAVRSGRLGAIVNPCDSDALEEAILAAVSQEARVVSPGLRFFGIDRFRERLDAIVDAVETRSTSESYMRELAAEQEL